MDYIYLDKFTIRKMLLPYIFKYSQIGCLRHFNLNNIKLT